MSTRSIVGAAALCAALVSGCGQQAAGPAPGTCGSADTDAVIKRVLVDNLHTSVPTAQDAAAAKQALSNGTAQLSVEAVRTVARDEAVGRSTCGAQLRITVPVSTFQLLESDMLLAATIGQAGWKRDGDGAVVRGIDYTVQPTDDRKQVYVNLVGPEPVLRGVGLMAIAAWAAAERGSAVPGGPTPAAASSPVPAPRAAVAPASDKPDGLCAGIDTATTAGALECEDRHFKAADDQLNANYKAAMARMAPDRQAVLRAEQRAWLAGRDTGCQAEAQQQGLGGTSVTLAVAGCVTQKTAARAAELAGAR